MRDRRHTEIKTAWRLERDQSQELLSILKQGKESLCKECLCQHCLDLQYCHHFRIQQGSERKGTEYVRNVFINIVQMFNCIIIVKVDILIVNI